MTLHRNLICLLGAVVFTVLFDRELIAVGHLEAQSMYPPDAALMLTRLEVILAVAVVYLLLRVASVRTGLLVATIALVFIVCGPAAYFTAKFRVGLHTAVSALLDSGAKDFVDLGWVPLRSLATAALAAPPLCLAAWLVARRRPAGRAPLLLDVAVILIVVGALVLDADRFNGRASAKVRLDYLPLGLVSQVWHYARDTRAYASKRDISQYDFRLDPASDDLVVVFVIGESMRAMNFSLNGYARPTNPELAKIPNLVSFTQARSSFTTTRRSLPVMLTRVGAARVHALIDADSSADYDVSAPESSFISVFNRLGFATYFFANWDKYGKWSTSETMLVDEATYSYYSDSWDNLSEQERRAELGALGVEDLARFAKQYDENVLVLLDHHLRHVPSARSLFVMHPYGAHFSYGRYPQRFEVFTPVCDFKQVGMDPARCGHERLVNSYDNAILYTDWLLAEIIARLRDRNAVLLYVGDHGESLGEGGRYFHSHDQVADEHRIPFIVWASDRYLTQPAHRAKLDALRAYSALQVTHDSVFHTVLDLAGIESDAVLDRRLSLCRPFIPVAAARDAPVQTPRDSGRR